MDTYPKQKLDKDRLVRLELELKDVKEDFLLLAENSSDVVIRESRNGRIKWCTPSGAAALGWGLADIMGCSLVDIVHPEDKEDVRRLKRMDLDSPRRANIRILNSQGGICWFLLSVRPVISGGKLEEYILSARSIQEEVCARGALEYERDMLRATWDSFLDPHVVVEAVRDHSGKIVDFVFIEANAAACAYNKTSRADLIGRRMMELLPAHEAFGLMDMYRNVIETGESLSLDNFAYPHDIYGSGERYYDIRAVKIGDALSYTWRDVTDRHLATIDLELRSRTDDLTQLLNRKGIFEQMETICAEARIGKKVAVLFCDFDRFKSINDTYGHAAGDEVLRVVAARVRACLRSTDDLGARVGGDEILIILHGVKDIKDAEVVADKLRRTAADPITLPDGRVISTTVSIGVTLARLGEKPDELMARADTAMYKTKNLA